jgi:hypothetical protein
VMGRSWAYARLSRLVADGSLEQERLATSSLGCTFASAEGLGW